MISFSNFLLTTTILFTTFNSCEKKTMEPHTISHLEQLITAEMEQQNVPALSVLIFNKNNIKYEQYFGKTNIAQNTTLAKEHLFLLASISKVVTATALLQLYDKGLFQLDDPINDYLPFSVHIPNRSTPITFQMLLTHTAAIKDGSALDNQYYDNQDSPISLRVFLEDYLTPNGQYYDANDNFYKAEPGTKHQYSNTGNALIALLVEEISGLDFNAYCKQHIFSPMGMHNSFWRLDEISQPIVQPYAYNNGQYQSIPHYTFTDYPNGGLRSNVTDMFQFLTAFTQAGTFNNNTLLKESTVNLMTTSQIPTLDETMGLHLFLLNEEHDLWGHDGGEKGVSTVMAFNKTTKIGVLIFSNQSDVDLDELVEKAYLVGKTL